jgi:hypothetical protein
MKKILLTSVALLIFISAQAQSFRTGIKMAANTTWLLNTNVFDANDEIDPVAAFGVNFGASATYMFNDMLGISLDIMYASVNQHYKGTNPHFGIVPMAGNYTMIEKLRYLDLPLLLKLTSEKGPYFEIGPKFSLLMNQTEEFDGDFGSGSASYKNDFNSLLLSIALGFGVDIKVAEHMFINVGLRLAYNPGSATKEISKDEILNGTHAFITPYSSYEDGDFTGSDAVYKYEKSHIASGGLLLGFTYEFGGN